MHTTYIHTLYIIHTNATLINFQWGLSVFFPSTIQQSIGLSQLEQFFGTVPVSVHSVQSPMILILIFCILTLLRHGFVTTSVDALCYRRFNLITVMINYLNRGMIICLPLV